MLAGIGRRSEELPGLFKADARFGLDRSSLLFEGSNLNPLYNSYTAQKRQLCET